jgi:HD-GYP domain-containing protein (c-di-GMP phosphodiesterase class II)/DNA-binding CsgD family transcriptional regulator
VAYRLRYTRAVSQAPTRLAELLGGLSLACDLADGFPPEKVLRTCVLGVELARRHGLSPELVRDVFYTGLLRYTGCTAFSHEEAHHYGAGDDIAVRHTMALADVADPIGTFRQVVSGVARSAGLLDRGRALARLLGDGVAMQNHARAQCEVSVRLATLVGASAGVCAALTQICERYDGRGAPARVGGDALALSIRVHQVADIVEIAHHRGGRQAALALARGRAGGQLDPKLVATFVADAPALFAAIEADGQAPSCWDRFLAAEPPPHAVAAGGRLDDVARAFALLADLKSGYMVGHSTGVAALAVRAAADLGLGEAERAALQRAALLHDIGRVSAPNLVWDKPGKLSPPEWERARMHVYWTERILSQAAALRPLVPIAAAGHERLDGGGYHRGLPASGLGRAARLLAAADAYHAMGEPRAHRPALSPAAAAGILRDECAAGRLDREAVAAVLAAAGTAPARGPGWPRGLSDREVEVLRCLARGQTNKEIAASLAISPRTAQHHVIHIYRKIDVSSRAAAALFAAEHGMLAPPGG